MKIFKISAIALLAMGFVACGGGEDSDSSDDLTESLDDLDEMLDDSDPNAWFEDGDDAYFTMSLPGHMESRYDLNQEASLQYGYVAEVGGEVLENYIIVLLETKEEIAGYELDVELDAMSYWEISANALGEDLDSYEIVTENPEVESINGMNCVISEMEGSMISEYGLVEVYYMLGVFEGENAFYQVLTWTILDQKSEFKADMKKMIKSFEEI